ncbi:Rpn family recombination-promoting nuclease/putative transposase [Thiorhodovibrio frisius]|uniref:Rpn family recombination-promoting nuclease/putative transposase n=1 Tax=Thiorhodovibrio frisius TaxID=631362 RepID=UPI001CBCF503|nr:Rpn family recombination-promoting nuclease/putative transposase [Thiorhodovibrio frisius]
MRTNPRNLNYKELFSHPELVQQLIEGFAPPEVATMMDFAILTNHSGHYITPLFEEKIDDVVWSVEVAWQGLRQRVFLFLLLEFQSSVDARVAIRLLHYVACFYDHLLKTKVTSLKQGLPPLLPIVLYNGVGRWTAARTFMGWCAPSRRRSCAIISRICAIWSSTRDATAKMSWRRSTAP